MARTHARIFSSLDEDRDWLALSFGAQWLYKTVLRQKKMTLAGQLDYRPARWAQLAQGLTPADVDRFARELEAGGFIVIDRETNELLVRTFVRHDSGFGRNSNLLKGVWNAWLTIESPRLKRVVVDNAPDEVWDEPKAPPPAEAVEMRWSEPPEPPVRTNGSDLSSNHQFELPDRTVLTPDPGLLTPEENTSASNNRSNQHAGCGDQISSTAPPSTARSLALVGHVADPPPTEPGARFTQTTWDLFWERWPRKTHKAEARKAWRALTGSGVRDVEILAGLDRWNAHWELAGTSEQYIPHPANWLKKRDWAERTPALQRPAGTNSDRKTDQARTVLTNFVAGDAAS